MATSHRSFSIDPLHLPFIIQVGRGQDRITVRDSSNLPTILSEVSIPDRGWQIGCTYATDSVFAVGCKDRIQLVRCVDWMPQEGPDNMHGVLEAPGNLHKFCHISPFNETSSSLLSRSESVFATSNTMQNCVCLWDGLSVSKLAVIDLERAPYCTMCVMKSSRHLWIGQESGKITSVDLKHSTLEKSFEKQLYPRGQITCCTPVETPQSHSELLCLTIGFSKNEVSLWDPKGGDLRCVHVIPVDDRPVKTVIDAKRHLLLAYHRADSVSVFDLRAFGSKMGKPCELLRTFVVQGQKCSDYATDVVRVRDDEYISANGSGTLALWNSSGKVLSRANLNPSGIGSGACRAICVPFCDDEDLEGREEEGVVEERFQFLVGLESCFSGGRDVKVEFGGGSSLLFSLRLRVWEWVFFH